MEQYLTHKPKPNEFCVTVISWEYPDRDPVPITEVYVGPEEHGSSGPFFDCNYHWKLYSGSDSAYLLFLWTYKLRSGSSTEKERLYDKFEIFHGKNHGRTWESTSSQYINSYLGGK